MNLQENYMKILRNLTGLPDLKLSDRITNAVNYILLLLNDHKVLPPNIAEFVPTIKVLRNVWV